MIIIHVVGKKQFINEKIEFIKNCIIHAIKYPIFFHCGVSLLLLFSASKSLIFFVSVIFFLLVLEQCTGIAN